MFPTLLKKEIQDYLISVRFVVLMALCILLIPLSLTDIADTGDSVKVRFFDAVRMYYATLERLVFSKMYTDLISDGDRGWGFNGSLPGQETPKNPPRFVFTFPRIAESLAQCVVDVGLLFGCGGMLFAAATITFVRYDVR